MLQTIRALLLAEGIDAAGCIPFSETEVLLPRLVPEGCESVIPFLIPYDTGLRPRDGVSVYAHVPDYHRYFAGLMERVLPLLRSRFPENRFCGFADHSPIREKQAAAKAGLGVIGRNSLLIHEKYGSYVFIGALFTDAPLPYAVTEIRGCEGCGKCEAACPENALREDGFDEELCLSLLSQKKRLTEREEETLAKNGVAWGCDRCQEVCPMNDGRMPSPIPFFRENVHGDFSASETETMPDDVFSSFAFSWRGRERITRNLRNLQIYKFRP